MIIRERIDRVLGPQLQETQLGFRKGRSTAEALHCMRRAAGVGEATGRTVLLLLLDWEQAFDKVRQERTFESMERVGIARKLVTMARAVYAKPEFYVCILHALPILALDIHDSNVQGRAHKGGQEPGGESCRGDRVR